ncbi:hypothetical protein B0J11DRAFT_487253 [Dendryphion nanum]|uniref:Conserved oligomeric Golgi complex subunit 1 n=1 Tax=Dendryphion nanum TaxID=256645 RepID=A0A9P9DUC0_9PLEO|nr:hypothetical protein B0J11DRAFT_487253 [Dendryphion nanum]
MTSEAPDPRTFKTWEDAFQYPIPVVRKLEQQLRSNAGENREKLRSLVGASYRDLLTTAETIIDMEVRMSSVETKLARIGHNCNSRNIERIARNAHSFRSHQRARDADRHAFASQLAVFRSCPTVVARLMEQEGGGLLLVAKVLVVGRELYKALSHNNNTKRPPIVDAVRDKVVALRRKLLQRIDKRLASATADASTLVESMCAFSLATNSTPTDVLRHFHSVRMETMVRILKQPGSLKEHGILALKLCLQTCQDTQTLFPRRLADALAKLKAQPLIRDPDVRALYELNLEVHERWISDEVRNYTPWPRHDELQRSGAEKILHAWSKQAISAFLSGTRTALEKTEDLKEVAILRQELIETWIVSGSRMAGVKSKNVLDDLRDAMNNQLGTIVRSRSQALHEIVSVITGHLTAWSVNNGTPNVSLWKLPLGSTDLVNGAQRYKASIVNTHQGRDDTITHVLTAYDKWLESILEVKRIVKSMKETRWDDPFTDDVDIDDSEDEFGDDFRQTLLSNDDPRLLEDAARDALVNALNNLGSTFAEIVQDVTGNDNKSLVVNKATFLLRIIREIGDRLPQLRLNDRSEALRSPFSSEILKPLHMAIAVQVVGPTTDAYQISLATNFQTKTKSQILWEGNPPLPVQPSSSAFRFLQNLTKSMANTGSDLWAPDSVQVLKGFASEEVAKAWRTSLDTLLLSGEPSPQVIDDTSAEATSTVASKDEGDEESEDIGEPSKPTPTSDDDEIRQQRLKQLLYDVLYIQGFLNPTPSSAVRSALVVGEIAKACDADNATQTRLKEKAADYARRTYLIFALLA